MCDECCLAPMQVVVAPPELHWQSFASPEPDGALSGEVRHPEGSLPPLGMSVRRIIAYRAMLAIEKPQAIINLGVGMPEARPPCLLATCVLPDLHLRLEVSAMCSLDMAGGSRFVFWEICSSWQVLCVRRVWHLWWLHMLPRTFPTCCP